MGVRTGFWRPAPTLRGSVFAVPPVAGSKRRPQGQHVVDPPQEDRTGGPSCILLGPFLVLRRHPKRSEGCFFACNRVTDRIATPTGFRSVALPREPSGGRLEGSRGTSLYFAAPAKISGCTVWAAAPAAPTVTFNSTGIFTGGRQVVSLQA
jgi:hypothetical protein